MPVQQPLNRCDTSPDLLPNPGLPVLFSAALHSFLPSAALCSHNAIEMLLLGTPKKRCLQMGIIQNYFNITVTLYVPIVLI
jgi:hypothetical protein